jgi:prepilin-type N-terminal cleavage/methylation domain-containing protein
MSQWVHGFARAEAEQAARLEEQKAGMRKARAFTITELLVVIGIIAVLLSVLLPALAAARSAARTTAGLSNLRQIGVAATNYSNDNKGFILPCAFYAHNSTTTEDLWFVALVYYGYLPNQGLANGNQMTYNSVLSCPSTPFELGDNGPLTSNGFTSLTPGNDGFQIYQSLVFMPPTPLYVC